MGTEALAYSSAVVAGSIFVILLVMALYRHRPYLHVFTASFAAASASYALAPAASGGAPFLASGLLMIAGEALLVLGVRRFAGNLKPWPARFYAYAAAAAAVLLPLAFAEPFPGARPAALSLFEMVATVEFAVAVARSECGVAPLVKRIVLAFLGTILVLEALRVGLAVFPGPASPSPVNPSSPNTFSFFLYNVAPLFWFGSIVALELASQQARLAEETARLEALALHDRLTGLYNRHAFERRMGEALGSQDRYAMPLSAVMLDVDRFKRVNDVYGHGVGDQVLVQVGRIVKESVRQSDLAFRWGGEEFIVVTPHVDRTGAAVLAEKLRAAIEAAAFPEVGSVTASFGVAERTEGLPLEDWIQRADQALYQAKNSGRNRVVTWTEDRRPGPLNVAIEWSSEWDSGNRIIDLGHRQLVEMGGELVSKALARRPAEELLAGFDALANHLTRHFREEEAELAAAGWAGAEGHALIHARLAEESLALRARLAGGAEEPLAIFRFVADTVIMEHLLKQDVLFFPALRGASGAVAP